MLSWEVLSSRHQSIIKSSSSHHQVIIKSSSSHHQVIIKAAHSSTANQHKARQSTTQHNTYHITVNQLIIQVVTPIRQIVLPHRLHVEVQSLKPVLERLPRLHLLQRRLRLTPTRSTHIERRLARVDQHLLQLHLPVFVALCRYHTPQHPLILLRASASYALTSVLTSSSLPSTSTVCCDANAM